MGSNLIIGTLETPFEKKIVVADGDNYFIRHDIQYL